MFGYIYITINKINGKKYVGKKKGNFDERYYGSGIILLNALNKYGKENFETKVLEYCDNQEILNEKEIYYISEINPEYNISKGGDGGDTLYNADKNYKNEIFSRRSESLSLTWNTLSEEKRKAWGESISKSKKGKSYNRPDYKHDEKTKKKISESNKGWHELNLEWKENHAIAMKKRIGIPNKNCWKKVEVDGVLYSSMKEACEKLNVSFPTLKKRIKNGKAKYV